MIARNVQSRITKLEARSTRLDEMLVIWRLLTAMLPRRGKTRRSPRATR